MFRFAPPGAIPWGRGGLEGQGFLFLYIVPWEIDILLIRPRQGGYCKDYKILITKGNKNRTLKKRACISYCSHNIKFINLDKNGKCIRENDAIGDPECGFTLGDMIGAYIPVECVKNK